MRVNTWILKPADVTAIRQHSPAWQVQDTIGKHPASCRQCGGTILKGEERLTFRLTALQSVLLTGHHRESAGHVHVKCGGRHERDERAWRRSVDIERVELDSIVSFAHTLQNVRETE